MATMDDTEERREEAVGLHALRLSIGEIAAVMHITYDRAYYLLDSAGIDVSRQHPTPEGPAVGVFRDDAKARTDTWSASDELLRRLRLYHPGGYQNIKAPIVGIFRGAPAAVSSFMGCSMARCVETV